MAFPKNKPEQSSPVSEDAKEEAGNSSSLATADHMHDAIDSPARRLQAHLERELSGPTVWSAWHITALILIVSLAASVAALSLYSPDFI